MQRNRPVMRRKNSLMKIDLEITQMIQLVKRDMKTVILTIFHIF